MRDFLRVLRVARRHGAWLLLALVCMVAVAGTTVFVYNLVRPMYDRVLQPVSGENRRAVTPGPGIVGVLDSFTSRAEERLATLVGDSRAAVIALAMLAVILKSGCAFVTRFAMARCGLATIRDLRVSLFESLLAQNPGFFHRHPSAVLVSRTTNDIQLLREVFAERLGDFVQDGLMVLVLTAYLLSLDLKLAVAVILLAPLLLVPVVHLSRRLRVWAHQAQEGIGDLATIVDETVRGIRVVQVFAMARFVGDRFRAASNRQFAASLRALAIQAANGPVMEILGAAAALALIAFASGQIANGRMTLGDFSAFLVAIYGAYNPLKRLNKFNLALQHAVVAAERVYEVIDAPVEIRDRPAAVELHDIGDGVAFSGVGFRYPEGPWVLRGFELELPRGQVVALVGISGAGKSTVAQLIPRFFDVAEGAVLIGGRDVRDLQLHSLRARIAVVTQETLLFNDTVRTNITCGQDDCPPADAVAAARAANAHEFIRELPQGYETVIGESGVKLSGGQRQRLAIARALLKDPPILILDEATSALDAESELAVRGGIERLMRNRTTLVIAHRLATVRRADAIAVISGGRVVELGKHAALLAAGGCYARMVEMQELT